MKLLNVEGVQLYSCWKPASEIGLTGCGIVVRIEKTIYGIVYHFLTDFGNVCRLTKGELISNYEFTLVEEDPLGRYYRQQDLLTEALFEYF